MSSRKRNPLERFLARPTRKTAIDCKCFDCVGGGADSGWIETIRTCPQDEGSASPCALHPFRPYKP